MGLEERDYMRDVPEYRRLVGLETAPAAGGGGAGKKPPPTTWADPSLGPPWWQSMSSPRRAYQLGQRGRAQVRIVFPGGFAYKWYRVG